MALRVTRTRTMNPPEPRGKRRSPWNDRRNELALLCALSLSSLFFPLQRRHQGQPPRCRPGLQHKTPTRTGTSCPWARAAGPCSLNEVAFAWEAVAVAVTAGRFRGAQSCATPRTDSSGPTAGTGPGTTASPSMTHWMVHHVFTRQAPPVLPAQTPWAPRSQSLELLVTDLGSWNLSVLRFCSRCVTCESDNYWGDLMIGFDLLPCNCCIVTLFIYTSRNTRAARFSSFVADAHSYSFYIYQ